MALRPWLRRALPPPSSRCSFFSKDPSVTKNSKRFFRASRSTAAAERSTAANARPFRSVLYMPCSNTRALAKAQSLPTDAIIFDLEDSVAPDAKAEARNNVVSALAENDYGTRYTMVRINGLDTAWGLEDVEALTRDGNNTTYHGLVLPKTESAEQVDHLLYLLPGTQKSSAQIWTMMETPRGILRAADIAAHDAVQGLVLGTNDLAKDLRCSTSHRSSLMTSLQYTVLAARAAGKVCLDGVYNAYKDEKGLLEECHEGRRLGFDGKTLIHPQQIASANDVFRPDDSELDLASRQVEAFERAAADGQGIAVVDGSIVENLHVETAKRLLAMADAIAQLEGTKQG